ncbi:MAG: hypothetical protein M0P94_02785 [Candidatus Absconditabacterales bacterium]|nr:hypothetical protein [Candidatus Absconditabacterales bacterium]
MFETLNTTETTTFHSEEVVGNKEKLIQNKEEVIQHIQTINDFTFIGLEASYVSGLYDKILGELENEEIGNKKVFDILDYTQIENILIYNMVNELIDKQKKYRGENNETKVQDNETKVQDNETKINVKDKVADIFHTTIIDNHEQSEEVQKQLEETHEQSEEVQKQLEETHEQSEEVQKQLDNKFISRIKVIKTLYMSLDDSLRGTSDEIELSKKNIELSQEYGLDVKDEDGVDYLTRYAQYLVSFNKIQEKINSGLELNEKEKEFVAMFTELNQNLGIEIAIAIPITLKSMKAETYETKIVRRSTSLKDATDSDAILDNKNIQKHIDNKAKEPKNLNLNIGLSELSDLPRYAIKKFKAKYSEYSDIVLDDGTINKEKEKNVDKATLDKIIEEYVAQYEEEKKKEILRKIHERALIGCFKGLTTYFDINSINQENFIKDIKLNINDDITVNNHELYVRGSIKGKNIGIYYNMDNGTVEMDDFLHKDGEGNLFVGANHGIREKLAFTLPTYDDLVKEGGKIDFSGILKKNDTEKDIDEQIQKTLDKTMDSSFKNENINKFIVGKHMEEYVAEQEILNHIFQNRLTGANYDPNLDFRQRDIKIEKSNNLNQHKLLSIINNTIEAQKTPNGLQRFRQAINKLDYFIERAKSENKSEKTSCDLFNELFSKDKMKDGSNFWKNNSGKMNYLIFFDIVRSGTGSSDWNNDSKIDLNLLEKVNLILENGGSLKDTNDLVVQERVSNYLESGEEKALLEEIEGI